MPRSARRRRAGARRALALLLVVMLAGAARLLAQETDEDAPLALHVYTLRHQPAGDAVALVQPLLSPRGTVDLRMAENTLVLHDTPSALERILPVLVAFDHPPQAIDVELWLVRASGPKIPVSPQPPTKASSVPAELLQALAEHLPYEQYNLIGSSKVRGLEGERMTFQVGGDYAVRFRLGTIIGDQRLRLADFEVALMPSNGDAVPLLRSHLNLWLSRTMVLALSAGKESSTALMVVVRCREAAPAARKHSVPHPRFRRASPTGRGR